MAIEVEITGTGAFAGHKSNISSYSYAEESTPVSPGDSSGGVGNLSLEVRESPTDTILLYNNLMDLSDSFAGRVTGKISSITTNDGLTTISGRARLGLLNTTGTVLGGAMTLGDFIEAILAAGSITTDIRIDPAIAAIDIIAPNYTGELWILLKDVCTAYQVEVAQIQNAVVVRDLRTREIRPLNISSEGWSVNEGQLAQFVEVAYYNYEEITNQLVHPQGGFTDDVQVYQVDANQTLVVDIPVDMYLTSIEQPTPQLFVGRDYTGPSSVYAVAGNDGLPVQVPQWTDAGGSVTLALKDSGTVIEATLVGANIPELGPFRLAVSSGPSDYYSSLRIIGSGVSFRRETLLVGTGVSAADAPTEIGLTIDNPLIDTIADAWAAGLRALVPFALPSRNYTVTARRVNRQGLSQSDVIYPSFAEYHATLPPGTTFTSWNAAEAGVTFGQLTQEQFLLVADDFENQAFGNIGGARVRHRDAYYRVRQATSTQDQVSFTAEADTLFGDFNPEWTGETFTDFNADINDLTFLDFSLIPLRRTA